MRYMLDTNICIYLIKGQPPQVLKRLALQREGDVVMSAITWAELRAGLEIQSKMRAHDERILALLAQRIPVLPFDEGAGMSYGTLRAAVRERSRHAMDRLIASHAHSLGLTLVTNNEADFRDYPGLALENWARA
jgi:tRNA(fMet)-specific endonuclease VapC